MDELYPISPRKFKNDYLTGVVAAPSTEDPKFKVWKAENRSDNRARRPGRPWCDYCKRPRHTKEKCWKLHPELKPHESRGHVAIGEKPQSASETNPFNKKQLELLQKLFSQQSNPANSNSTGPNLASGSIAQSSISYTALGTQLEKNCSWMIDSGTSDHMTGNASLFCDYSPCNENFMVKIVDSSLSKVTGREIEDDD
ncbi:hypothetical protein TorRG33x02_287670 [Trema orientale]|uniref:Retrovirus-related Pol polyprotein from transposon TNT 1-94-like beta-barrel domain-containing protein n=1 Tax=Trema orientale TaxID=63057 RepID=A0A2P5CES2_TREOI|nr:hypothetical protein TorRG33x02_287670 [Trema orientale]